MKDRSAECAQVIAHLEQELVHIRTGRANPALIEQVKVSAYNTVMPLVQLASITTADVRTIVVQPWDRALLKDIERGLTKANLGISPVNDGTVLRLTVPPLTEERRREYLKILSAKLEQARVRLRKIREDELRSLRSAKQEGTLSENDFFSQQKQLQKQIDSYMDQIDHLGAKKEHELMTI